MKASKLVSRAVLSALALLWAHHAFAGLAVRNDTDKKVWVAVGYSQLDQWYAAGWYAIAPGGTMTLLPGNLNQRYYYLYAYDENNLEWSGEYGFCTVHQSFTALPRHAVCSDRSHRQKGFFQIDTENRPDHLQTLALTRTPKGPDCRAVSELSASSALLLERFIDVALPRQLTRFEGLGLGNGATMQFQVNRNGPARVQPGAAGRRFGTLTIDVPIKIVDVRVDWLEPGRSASIPRQKLVENAALTVHSTVEFALVENRLQVDVASVYTWDYKPSFPMFGRSISTGAYAEPYVNNMLKTLGQQWYYAIDPLLQTFVSNNCDWKPIAETTASYINHYEVNEMDGARLQQLVREFLERELRF